MWSIIIAISAASNRVLSIFCTTWNIRFKDRKIPLESFFFQFSYRQERLRTQPHFRALLSEMGQCTMYLFVRAWSAIHVTEARIKEFYFNIPLGY